MNTDEMTTFGTANEVKNENKQASEQASKNGWQKVTIGGVTGILMGAAGVYAANGFGAETPEKAPNISGEVKSHEAENGLNVAEVDDSLSFGEAFAAARNEVGAGGVFHWRGGIYNTFTESEWDSMTPQEHAQFAHQVEPEVRPEEMHAYHHTRDTHHDTAPQHRDNHDDTPKKEDSHDEAQHLKQDEPKQDEPKQDEPKPGTAKPEDEPEVHYLGLEQRTMEDGSTVNVGHMTIDEEHVALVDFDDDKVFDVAISDANHNNQLEEDEVKDISEAELTVNDFALAVAEEQGEIETPRPDVTVNQQEQIGEDMPDYMNDVDMQSV